jgi:hypothetical protein
MYAANLNVSATSTKDIFVCKLIKMLPYKLEGDVFTYPDLYLIMDFNQTDMY